MAQTVAQTALSLGCFKSWIPQRLSLVDGPWQELLSWSIQTLMAAAGQAMQQKNPGAVVACIRQLDHMTGTGYNSHRGHGLHR